MPGDPGTERTGPSVKEEGVSLVRKGHTLLPTGPLTRISREGSEPSPCGEGVAEMEGRAAVDIRCLYDFLPSLLAFYPAWHGICDRNRAALQRSA